MTIQDKIYGCLMGGAVGDALGRATEGMMYWEIRQTYGVLDEMQVNCYYDLLFAEDEELVKAFSGLNRQTGTWTDDTTLGCYLIYEILKRKDRIQPDDFARVIMEKMDAGRFWVNEQIVKMRLEAGISSWDAGLGGIGAGCAAMGIAPVGIINAGDPEQAFQDGMCLAMVNSNGENRDFGAAFACAIASAMMPGATLDQVLDDVNRYGTDIVRRGLELAIDLADTSRDTADFTERYYGKLLDYMFPQAKGMWTKDRAPSSNGREYVPVAFALWKMCGGDLNRALIAAANFGRDCDSLTSLTGQLGGALVGGADLRKEWVDAVNANERNRSLLVELFEDENVQTLGDTAPLLAAALKAKCARQIERNQTVAGWL